MLRAFPWAVSLLAVAAATCQAQIVSNPVVTSWPTGTMLTTYPMPAAPVSADVCTPPVVTYCHPCAGASAPVTSFYAPRALPVPVTLYRWPTPTVLRPVVVGNVAVPATRVNRPVWQTIVPSVPVTTMYAPTVAASPMTSYFAPTAAPTWSAPISSSALPAAPVTTGGGCHCQGR